MKTILITFSLIISLIHTVHAQHSRSLGGKWTYVRVAGDSIKPTGLYFIDSLHGILSCSRTMSWWPSHDQHNGNTAIKMYWFRTSDGGNSWSPIKFENADYRDSACNERPISFSNLIYTKKDKIMYLGNNGLLSMDTCFSKQRYNILSSDDYGITWVRKSFPIDSTISYSYFRLLGSLGTNSLFLYHYGQKVSCGKLLSSSDYGAKFEVSRSDNVFESITKANNDSLKVTANVRFDNSDMLNWTVTATSSNFIFNCDTTIVGCGLTTLISSNVGATWTKYKYVLPGYEDRILAGTPQFIKNTPSVYYFTFNEGWDNTQEGEINRYAGLDLNDKYYFRSESGYNTSYLYSSDYGKTWAPQHKYGSRRRAFEAVDVENVWMTVCKEDNIYVPDRRAGTIVRTTDNGLSWEEDQSTLIINDVGVFDGRIISFSDPRHGWIAANDASQTYIFRWVADEKSAIAPEEGEDQESFRIKIYPNPAQEQTNILLPETRTVARVELFNGIGRKILIEPKIVNNTASFSTRAISIGCYYVKVTTTKGTTYIRPVLVMR